MNNTHDTHLHTGEPERAVQDLNQELNQDLKLELHLERRFDAPPDLVYQAWTERQHLMAWSAPHGLSVTESEGDLRVGGAWRSTMRTLDGIDHRVTGIYREIVPNERLVFTHAWMKEDGSPGHETLITVTLESPGDATRMTFHQGPFTNAASRDGHAGGWAESFERLTALLESEKTATLTLSAPALPAPVNSAREPDAVDAAIPTPDPECFVISREFDASRDQVFSAWTDADRLAEWFGPKGVTITIRTNDLQRGGMMHYGMRMPDGNEMWGKWTYRQIVPPERLAIVIAFSDEMGETIRHPFAPAWPLETFSVMTLSENTGKTTLTLNWSPWKASEIERKAFAGGFEGMTKGWGGTLTQLADYLARR